MNTHKPYLRQVHSVLRWSQRILLVTSVILLGYVAGVALEAKFYQYKAKQYLEMNPPPPSAAQGSLPESIPVEGDILGRIDIERLGFSVAILEGTKSRTLRLGLGHVSGTPLPGELGNSGIAGHRDTFFRPLKDVRQDDAIELTTLKGVSHYQVDWIRVVTPDDMAVLGSSDTSALTLVTCYPFYLVGDAPDRFVVHATRIN